jgi:phosphatidylglycerophosphate synthase
MNLHRVDKKPDWELVEPEQHTVIQRIAANTNGYVTPGNGITLAGGALVAAGLTDIYNGNTYRGIALATAGRFADLFDGMVAHKTGTKSAKGEALDAGMDKLAAVGALGILAVKDLVPMQAIGLFGAQNIVNAVATAVAKKRGAEIHASRAGKLNTVYQWVSLGLFTLSKTTETNFHSVSRVAEFAGYATEVLALGYGAVASAGYVKDATAPIDK